MPDQPKRAPKDKSGSKKAPVAGSDGSTSAKPKSAPRFVKTRGRIRAIKQFLQRGSQQPTPENYRPAADRGSPPSSTSSSTSTPTKRPFLAAAAAAAAPGGGHVKTKDSGTNVEAGRSPAGTKPGSPSGSSGVATGTTASGQPSKGTTPSPSTSRATTAVVTPQQGLRQLQQMQRRDTTPEGSPQEVELTGLDLWRAHKEALNKRKAFPWSGTNKTPGQRRKPEDFRAAMQQLSSSSQMSMKNITEYYNLPDRELRTVDDVYRMRGYQKVSKLDEGAFGLVSLGMRLSDKQLVAIKEVDLRHRRAKRIEEMRRELFVLQKIDSKYVVHLIEHFIIGQMLVIIMEYCSGGNLTAHLKGVSSDEEQARALFRQMALAIKILHKNSIAHRDVKLNNFLTDNSKKIIRIADFGLSVVAYRKKKGLRMAKTYCGTEPYMSPELLKKPSGGRDRAYNAYTADVWSLGVCLYAMLTRTFPFKVHTTSEEIRKAQMSRRWRFPHAKNLTLSDEVKDLVFHMLDPDCDRRITIVGVLAHPWLNPPDKAVALTPPLFEPPQVDQESGGSPH